MAGDGRHPLTPDFLRPSARRGRPSASLARASPLALLLFLSAQASPTQSPVGLRVVRADAAFPVPAAATGLRVSAEAAAPDASGLAPAEVPFELARLDRLSPDGPLAEAARLFEAGSYPQALALLDAEARREPPSLEIRVLRALALRRAGSPGAAVLELLSLADLLPALRARCLYEAAQGLEDQGTFADAAALFGSVAATSPLRHDALLAQARTLAAAGQPAAAARVLTPLVDLPAPASGFGRDLGAEALWQRSGLEERLGRRAEAAADARSLALRHPLWPLAEQARQRADTDGAAPFDDDERVERAELILAGNRNVQALGELQPLARSLALHAASHLACRVHFDVGKALKKERRHPEALVQLADVVDHCRSTGEAELRARALYLAGQSAAIVEPRRGEALFARLAREFPESSFADDALFFLADLEADDPARRPLAAADLERLIARYPAGDYAGEARFRLFWLARKRGVAREGLPALDPFLGPGEGAAPPRLPEPWLRARFWAAVTSSDVGALGALAHAWPASYYGDLSRSALAANASLAAPPDAPPAQATPSSTPPDAPGRVPTALRPGTLAAEPRFATGVLLLQLGLLREADEELTALATQSVSGSTGRVEPLLLLALALDRAGDPRASHAIVKPLVESGAGFPADGAARAGLVRLLFQIAYPRAFRAEVERAAAQAQVPADLLQGLMREESALDPLALSSTGAVGLCQLMPRTAQQVARHLGLGTVTTAQLQVPALNIRLGASYLGDLLRRFQGRAPLAVAAYNAGEGAVDRWLLAAAQAKSVGQSEAGSLAGRPKALASDPLASFVEDIPVAETRNYVKRVLTSAAVYRTLPAEPEAAVARSSNRDGND